MRSRTAPHAGAEDEKGREALLKYILRPPLATERLVPGPDGRVSVEGSYDSVKDISSSSLGNLGADVRWRLEFE